MHQLFPSQKRMSQSRADRASESAVPELEMSRRKSAEVEFDDDEDSGWVHFVDHDQLDHSQSSKEAATGLALSENSKEDSHERVRRTAWHAPDGFGNPDANTAAQGRKSPLAGGTSTEHVTTSNYEDLWAIVTKAQADLQQEVVKSETDRFQVLEHIQSLRQELRDRGSQQALTLRGVELNFKKELQAQGEKLDDLSSKLQSQQDQHEQQTHAALEDVSQKAQGQNTFVLEKIKAEFANELKQLKEKISAVQQDLHAAIDQRLSTQADALELALNHERSAREYNQCRLAEDLQDQRTSTKHAIETAVEKERVRSEQAMADLQQTITTEIEAEVERVNVNVGDALRSLKAEMDGKRDALAANIDNAFDECKRIEKALQGEASKRVKDTQAVEARLKEVEQTHAKDVLVLKELLDKIQEEFSVMNEWNQNLQGELELLREQQQAGKTSVTRKTVPRDQRARNRQLRRALGLLEQRSDMIANLVKFHNLAHLPRLILPGIPKINTIGITPLAIATTVSIVCERNHSPVSGTESGRQSIFKLLSS